MITEIYWKQDEEIPECSCIVVEHKLGTDIKAMYSAERIEGRGLYLQIKQKYSALLFFTR